MISRCRCLYGPLLTVLCALLRLTAARFDWDESTSVGPSKHYEELEKDNFHKKVFRPLFDVVVVFYAEQCTMCKDLKPAQEKAAEKIKNLTRNIKFARIDDYRFGTDVAFGNKQSFSAELPGFHEHNTDIPKMFYIKAGNRKPILVPHMSMGAGKKGHKGLIKFIKEVSSFDLGGRSGNDLHNTKQNSKLERDERLAAQEEMSLPEVLNAATEGQFAELLQEVASEQEAKAASHEDL